MSTFAFLHGSNDLYGASRVLADDVALLVAAGHEVRVSLPAAGPLTSILESSGAKVFVEPLVVLRRVASPAALRVPVSLPESARGADIVVVWTLALAAYLPVLRARRSVVVTSVHEIVEGSAGQLLGRVAGLFSHAIMTNSDTTSRWISGAGAPASRVVRAYPAAPPFAPLQARPHQGDFVGLLAGRINGNKGHLEAVRAGLIARTSGVEFRLILLGGSYPGQEMHREALMQAIAGKSWIDFRGEVADVVPHLADSDVMLIPSTTPEPFGIVALEAWSAGRRIIASDQGGLAEAAEMVQGVKVPSGDVDALAAAIVRVARSEELRSAPPQTASASVLCTNQARASSWDEVIAILVANKHR